MAPSIGTFKQFLNALQAMAPSLVHFIPEESVLRLQLYTAEPPPSDRTVTLTSLRTLSVICNTNDCVRLLDHLSVNSAATMCLTGHGTTGIRRLVEHLSDHFFRSAPLQRLNISFARSTGEIFITGYKNPERDVLQDNNDPAMRLILDIVPGGALSPLLTATLEGANTLFSRVKTVFMFVRKHRLVQAVRAHALRDDTRRAEPAWPRLLYGALRRISERSPLPTPEASIQTCGRTL